MIVSGEPARRTYGLMLLFGFSSGLPLFLTNFKLQQWLSESHVSLRAIGATACPASAAAAAGSS